MEHASEYCQCQGKRCTKCNELLCIGNYTKDRRLTSKLKSKCRVCSNAENKQWRQNNAEYDQERKRAWEKDNPERVTEQRKRRLRKQRKTNRRSPVKNRPVEEFQQMDREVNQKQYAKKREKNIARVMAYFHSRPGYRASVESRRRTRKTQAGGSYTLEEWEALKSQCDYRCLSCGKKEPEIQLHADHVIPVILGGSSNISNIQPLCKSCNSSKGAKIIDFRSDWKELMSMAR